MQRKRTFANSLAFAAVVALGGVVPGSPATAPAVAGEIQRCASPDGTTLYTDKPCAAFGATAVAMPGELRARLVDAAQAEYDAGTGGYPAMDYVDASLPLGPAPAGMPGRRSPADGCARSPTQLAMDLQGAFALGEVNRIAESWHWVGMDHGAAMQVMARLERMARSTALETQYHDASLGGFDGWASAGQAQAPGHGILQLTLGGEGGHEIVDLQVERYDGCYFVRF